jgi:ABC-type bacteriocin/lantibiotic exporter with double-glycine peptidase domain
MEWGCTLVDIALQKGAFEFEINDSLTLHGAYKKIPIVGKTGSGKSSFLKAIFGLEEIKEGTIEWFFPNGEEVIIDRYNISNIDKIRKEYFGFAFQDSTLTEYLSVQENLLYPLLMIGQSHTEAIRIVEDEIENYLTDSESAIDILAQFPHELSGGQRQRIGIARALYHNPEVLVLDEATSALDNETEKAFIDALNNLKGKLTIIMIAHRLNTVENCEIIFSIEKGTLVEKKNLNINK